MTQLTNESIKPNTPNHAIRGSLKLLLDDVAKMAKASSREEVRSNVVNRLYRKIPFSLACELHELLIAGDTSPKTKQLIREALVHAKCHQPS